MNREDMYNGITGIRPEFLEEADKYKSKKVFQWKNWIAVAACVALILSVLVPYMGRDQGAANSPFVLTVYAAEYSNDIRRKMHQQILKHNNQNQCATEKRKEIKQSKIEGLNKDEFTNWIFVTGNRKCGKSIMLSAFATEFAMKKNKQVSFVNSANMVKELFAIVFKDKEEFNDRMTLFAEVPLLVLDGFGNEVVNEFTRDNIMFPLLTARSDLGLPTFFASDLEFNDIKSLYSVGKNNGEIRGKQLMSLIKGNCGEIYDITGISYRK